MFVYIFLIGTIEAISWLDSVFVEITFVMGVCFCILKCPPLRSYFVVHFLPTVPCNVLPSMAVCQILCDLTSDKLISHFSANI